MTLNNEKQTVNDERGNPIVIGTIVIWRIVDTTKAVFNVQNYRTFLGTSATPPPGTSPGCTPTT